MLNKFIKFPKTKNKSCPGSTQYQDWLFYSIIMCHEHLTSALSMPYLLGHNPRPRVVMAHYIKY